jgi:Ca2+-binding EF-hand superfamily protein
MYRIFTISVGAALLGVAAQAQGVDDLPDRPIARSEVIAVVRRQFAAMDTNRDRVVSEEEFLRYRDRQERGAGETSQLAAFEHVGRRWFERADANGDGRVTSAEAMERPLHLFEMADTDGDGVVSVQEKRLATILMSLGGG